jgi:hypothetical protein
MVMRAMHSPVFRGIQGLVGAVLFVEGGLYASAGGVALIVAGAVLMITAGADVCLLDIAARRHHV